MGQSESKERGFKQGFKELQGVGLFFYCFIIHMCIQGVGLKE
jgi:hypothetical protein